MESRLFQDTETRSSSSDRSEDIDNLSSLICQEKLEISNFNLQETTAIYLPKEKTDILEHPIIDYEKSIINPEYEAYLSLFSDEVFDQQTAADPINILQERSVYRPQLIPASVYFKELEAKEVKYQADPLAFENRQTYINPNMRAELVDWMMDISSDFIFKRETLYMAISHVDRFTSRYDNICKTSFQLVGLAALFVASKAEEITAPKVTKFLEATSNAYDETELYEMEKCMLKRLD